MANIQILKVAHAFFLGARGEAGGAPSKDSIVGVALVQGNLVSFSGRRGGKLKFFTHKKASTDAVMARFERKLSGNPFGKHIDAHYSQVANKVEMQVLLGEDFADQIGTGFYKAMANKQLNINTRVVNA